jgi:nucleoid-associated protein YgaU
VDQDLKKLLKRFNLQESTVSTVLGILVVLITLGLIFNYWRSTRKPVEQASAPTPTAAPGEVKLVEKDGQMVPANLPTKHVVVAGENLWSIATKYFGSGYNWVDIATENKLSAPYALEKGQELNVPQVAVKSVVGAGTPTTSPTVTGQSNTGTPTQSPTATAEPTRTSGPTGVTGVTGTTSAQDNIQSDKYTVAQGDHLWGIAVRAYGDGYKWVEIARANKLVNPNLIYPDQELVLPR